MRIYANAYELMSETGRNLWEMGAEVKPKTYQDKVIEGDDNFITKELICEQYCLTDLPDEDLLFLFDPRSKDWTKAEFVERVSIGKSQNPGEAYKLRPDLWEQFINSRGKFDYNYNDRMRYEKALFSRLELDNLSIVIKQLMFDHQTRKAVLPIYTLDDVSKIPEGKRIPCSMYYDFLVREVNGEEQLNITYHQRSADYVTHFGNDVFLAWKLMQYVASLIKVKPGYLYHTIDSLHSYKKDWVKLKTSVGDFKK